MSRSKSLPVPPTKPKDLSTQSSMSKVGPNSTDQSSGVSGQQLSKSQATTEHSNSPHQRQQVSSGAAAPVSQATEGYSSNRTAQPSGGTHQSQQITRFANTQSSAPQAVVGVSSNTGLARANHCKCKAAGCEENHTVSACCCLYHHFSPPTFRH